MKLKSVKNASELKLDGVKVELAELDGSLQSVRFEDAAGHVVVVSMNHYALHAAIPAPKATVTKYRLHGTLGKVLGAVDATFDSQREAEARRDELNEELGYAASVSLSIDPVTVEAES